MQNTEKFTNRAVAYTRGRPDYAESFIDYLYNELGFSTESHIADIGCGTGKFTKQLLDRGSFVYGVEPNDDMRIIAEKELSDYDNFEAVNGEASYTKLGNNSVNFVTAAQAFHWFDVEKFHCECKRILKHDGKVILVWNTRDINDAVNKELFELNKKFCSEFKGFSGGMKEDDERIDNFFRSQYKKLSFENPLCFDEDRFINRLLSGSYALKEGDEFYSEYILNAKKIFSKYQNDGIIKIGNLTVVYIGSI